MKKQAIIAAIAGVFGAAALYSAGKPVTVELKDAKGQIAVPYLLVFKTRD